MKKIFLVAVILAIAAIGVAQIPGMSILEDVDITRDGEATLVTVNFTCSVSYMRHFPDNNAKQVQVRVKPLPDCNAEPGMMGGRDIISSFGSANDVLNEISYEGNNMDEPSLYLYFNKQVSYEIKQGKDFRSIVIRIY